MRARQLMKYCIITFLILSIALASVHGDGDREDRDGDKEDRDGDRDHRDDDDKEDRDDDKDDFDDIGLKPYFYKKTCPSATYIIKSITTAHVAKNTEMPAKLLRLHYHDCFVKGCDASILLDPVGNGPVEKQARPNLSLGGFEVIDEIKTKLEQVCPGVVSCADIIAISARDAVSVPFGEDLWRVATGRRDGMESTESEALDKLPSAFGNFSALLQNFQEKGLNLHDLVLLSSAHTIGRAHCGPFFRRLFSFDGKGNPDPSLNATYAEELREKCGKKPDPATTVEMDPDHSTKFDNNYFKNLLQNKGLFVSDAALLTDKRALKMIQKLQDDPDLFVDEFAKSVRRMGAMAVLTGNKGQIRTNCRFVNA